MNISLLEYKELRRTDGMWTDAFTAAINACVRAGGGSVTVPAGEYETGSIELKSNVHLHLEDGVMIYGSRAIEDYQPIPYESSFSVLPHTEKNRFYRSLIFAVNAHHIGVSGRGVIDARWQRKFTWVDSFDIRPLIVTFIRCEYVDLHDVTMKNPGFFTLYSIACRQVRISDVNIYSMDSPNGDGLDFDGSENVTITNCVLETGDDAIGLKSTDPNNICRNFIISNCIIRTDYAAVRLGPESTADMSNIIVTNCVFDHCGDGIKIQACSSGIFSNLRFSNIIMNDVYRPFFVTISHFSMSELDEGIFPPVGSIRRLTIEDITATVRKSETLNRQSFCAISGLLESYIEDITLRNLQLFVAGGGSKEQAERLNVPELLDFYECWPEPIQFRGELPGAGMFLRHVKRADVSGCVIVATENDMRPAVFCDDVIELTCNDLRGYNTAEPMLYRMDSKTTDRYRTTLDFYDSLKDCTNIINLSLQSKTLTNLGKDELIHSFHYEGNGRIFLHFPLLCGGVRVILNGEAVDTYLPPEPYRYATVWAMELTGNISKNSENTLSIVPLCSGEEGNSMFRLQYQNDDNILTLGLERADLTQGYSLCGIYAPVQIREYTGNQN